MILHYVNAEMVMLSTLHRHLQLENKQRALAYSSNSHDHIKLVF